MWVSEPYLRAEGTGGREVGERRQGGLGYSEQNHKENPLYILFRGPLCTHGC